MYVYYSDFFTFLWRPKLTFSSLKVKHFVIGSNYLYFGVYFPTSGAWVFAPWVNSHYSRLVDLKDGCTERLIYGSFKKSIG